MKCCTGLLFFLFDVNFFCAVLGMGGFFLSLLGVAFLLSNFMTQSLLHLPLRDHETLTLDS